MVVAFTFFYDFVALLNQQFEILGILHERAYTNVMDDVV